MKTLFQAGDIVKFWHGLRRVSGEVYEATPEAKNAMGATMPQKLCVTAKFGRNQINILVDVDYSDARIMRRPSRDLESENGHS